MTLRTEQTTNATVFGLPASSFAVLTGVAGLMGLGLLTLHAVDLADLPAGQVPKGLLVKQASWLALSMVVMLIIRSLNYQRLADGAYLFFGILLFLLAVVLVGKAGKYLPFLNTLFPLKNGSYRWINLRFFQFQPSEFIKIAYILGLARYLRYRSNYRTLRGLLGPFALTLLPTVLILLEPDLGTVMLLLPVLFIMLFAAGAKIKHLTAIVMLMIMSIPFLFFLMHDYQRGRVAGVLLQSDSSRKWIKEHPWIKDQLYKGKNLDQWTINDEGYHLYHSKTAMGLGGVLGCGYASGPYLDGTRWLPECHNDFVFAIIGHQFGLVGTVGVILLYLVIAAGLVEIAATVEEPFGRLIAVGVLAMLLAQAFINMGMTIGLMPITGVTLPFLSYGGSSLLTYFILIGLALAVDRTRPINIGPRPFEFSTDD